MNHSLTPLRLAALAALALTTTATQASVFLTEHISGSFDAVSSFGGTAFGSDRPFTLSATFDASAGVPEATGVALFPTTGFTLDLPGIGTFTGNPADVNVVLGDSSGLFFDGIPVAGMFFVNHGSGAAYPAFSTTTPTLDVTAPAPTVFSGNIGSFAFSVSLPLTGVPGGLVVHGASGAFSASITAVPEPAEYAAVAGLALGVFALVRRSRQAAAQN